MQLIFYLNKGLCNHYEGLGGHPYHTECVSQPVDNLKAIKKICEKNGNVPNLSKGGGEPQLWSKTKLFPFFSFEDFPKLKSVTDLAYNVEKEESLEEVQPSIA